MIAPLSWLLSYTDIDNNIDVHKFASDMTISGTKVESVDKQSGEIEKVILGKCLSVSPHENSDHLQVCIMKLGDYSLQIVTGAPNIRLGAYVPIALDGSTLAKGVKIKNGKLRGVDSFGMMCSFEELGLDYKDFAGGIDDGVMILQDLEDFKNADLDLLVGKEIMEILGFSDTIIDFEVTSNRADCFSILGLALESAVTEGGHFTKPCINLKEEGSLNTNEILSVINEAPDLCSRYTARVVTDVQIAPSPKWMKERLQAAGVRSINNIVDITNYVMLEYGQPMHAFDKRTIHNNQIIVRRAKDGENITTLDKQVRILDSEMLVISDSDGAVAIAGVMGGENSEIRSDTTTIIFESAIFDGVKVRQCAKKIGLRTESSSRFEKGLDTITCAEALDRAAQLVEELGAGKVCKGVVDCYPVPKVDREIDFSVEWINRFIGIHATEDEMVKILESIKCTVDIKKGVVIPPSFRGDLICNADIAEEIARFYGYNNIESSLLATCETTMGGKSKKQLLNDRIRNILTGRGYNEMLSFSFMSPNVFDKIRLAPDDKLRDTLVITNPLGEDFSVMRTTMLPSILESLGNNYSHRVPIADVFEISYVYIKQSEDINIIPEHREILSLGKYGTGDFFSIKGDVECLLHTLKITDYEFEAVSDNLSMHPGRTARLIIQGKEVGILGQIHPQTAENWGCPNDTFVAMLQLTPITDAAITIPKQKELPKFPAITRDIAIVIDKNVAAGNVEKMIRQRGGKNLEECKLFDCYEGTQVATGKKSLAYSLSFRDSQKTLTDEDVAQYMAKILNGLTKMLGAELRV